MEVDEVPDKFDGTAAKIVIGQIHGGDHQLVRLYYDKGSIYWVNGRNEVQAKDVVHQFRDANGRTPSISLDEKFSYEFDVHGNDLTLSLRADGTTYSSRIEIGGGWSDNHFYFKAGLYLGTNETTSRGDGQVSVYDIRLGSDASHPVESPRPSPVTEPDPPTNPPSQPSPTAPASLTGTNQGDLLAGTQGDDVIAGRNGNDVIAGMGGHDVISGGTGSDLYRVGTLGTSVSHIQDWEAKDQLLLDADVFGAVASGVEAEHFVVGSAALERDDHIIFSQSTGRVLYDRDGSGTAAAVQFAEIENGMRLTHSDFDLI
jgi:Ca2+-binding RTX toxin-like protein